MDGTTFIHLIRVKETILMAWCFIALIKSHHGNGFFNVFVYFLNTDSVYALHHRRTTQNKGKPIFVSIWIFFSESRLKWCRVYNWIRCKKKKPYCPRLQIFYDLICTTAIDTHTPTKCYYLTATSQMMTCLLCLAAADCWGHTQQF